MRMTTMSDYALRVMMYAASAGDRLVTIEETARTYNISRAHLMKVVNALTREGYLTAVRGRAGGVVLAKPADEIRLGRVVRSTEPDFALVECFADGSACMIDGHCGLKSIMRRAMAAFLAELDSHTLASAALGPKIFHAITAATPVPIARARAKVPERARIARSRA